MCVKILHSIKMAKNYYYKIPDSIIDLVISERGLDIKGSYDEKRKQLFLRDEKDPNRIQYIKYIRSFKSIKLLSLHELFIYGALKNIRVDDVTSLNKEEMLEYIKISLLLIKPKHKSSSDFPKLITTASDNVIQVFSKRLKGISGVIIRFLERDQLKEALEKQDPSSILENSDIMHKVERFYRIKISKYVIYLSDLYNRFLNRDSNIITLIREEVYSPMEEIILNFDKYPLDDIINQFGMIIPKSWEDELQKRVLLSLHYYKNIVERGEIIIRNFDELESLRAEEIQEYFNKLTDVEILSLLQVFVPYEYREELIYNLRKSFFRKMFLIPLNNLYNRAINKTTVSGVKITQNNAETHLFIGYGTCKKFYVYTFKELYDSFKHNEQGELEFRIPYVNKSLTNLEISSLQELLNFLNPNEEVDMLKGRIENFTRS